MSKYTKKLPGLPRSKNKAGGFKVAPLPRSSKFDNQCQACHPRFPEAEAWLQEQEGKREVY